MSDVANWVEEVRNFLPGAVDAALEREIRAVVREFCTVSTAVTERITLSLSEGTSSYALVPVDASMRTIGLLKVVADDRAIPIVQAMMTTPSTDTGSIIRYAWVDPVNVVNFSPVPDADSPLLTVYATIALAPKFDSDYVPDIVHDQWFDIILAGILGRLLGMPSKPWTNAQLALYHMRRFRNGMAIARDTSRRSFSVAERQFTFPSWA